MNLVTRLYLLVRKYILKIDDRSPLEIALSNGMKVGRNCCVMDGCMLDPGHCWLIEMGDRVTLAQRVHILAHDASTKRALGYAVIGRVVIGSDVFIGAGSIILPGVTIGDRVIVGTGSVVTHSLEANAVYAGNPARRLYSYEEYFQKRKEQLDALPVYDASYKIGTITEEQKAQMVADLQQHPLGFIV